MSSTHRLAKNAVRVRSAHAAASHVFSSAEECAVLAREANGSVNQRCRLKAPVVANVGQFVGAAEAAGWRALSSPARAASAVGAVLVRRANAVRVRSALVAASRGLRGAEQQGALLSRGAAARLRASSPPACVATFGATRSVAGGFVRRRAYAVQPLRPNPSIERTNNGGRRLADSAASRAPLFAAHVER